MVSKAQAKATDKYNAKAYDRLAIRVYKGQAEQIQAHAQSKGMSINAYINALIAADMGEKLKKPDKQKEEREIATAPRRRNIEELDLSIRTYNKVKRAGCNTEEELREYLKSEKCVISEGGRVYKEIEDALKR